MNCVTRLATGFGSVVGLLQRQRPELYEARHRLHVELDGDPHKSREHAGEEVPVAVQVVADAPTRNVAASHNWLMAAEVLARRRGHGCDFAVVDVLLADGERWLAELGDDPCAAVLDAEPEPL